MSKPFTTVSVRSSQGLSFNWAFTTEEEAIHHLSELMAGFRDKAPDRYGQTEFKVLMGGSHWNVEVKE